MKRLALLLLSLGLLQAVSAQTIRPDAFPPVEEPAPKVLNMATTVEEMASWNRYPTYSVYVEMMQRFASQYPTLCHLDTIGTSVEGRLILSLAIDGAAQADSPQFFYSSTIHGDEVTGYYLMLRLCDTLLSSYGTSPYITQLLNTTQVFINPLANPDGTYHMGNNTVQGSQRYNANYVDLNRNYPDPFGTAPLSEQQQENTYMINYVDNHHFALSANLHGGSEVMNYPWDSFTSTQRPHEQREWWEEVGKRFVDTCRVYDSQRFRSVNNNGVVEGGDWYVISNGRQDYFNYYNGIREMTMELSTTKTLSTDQLCHYWNCESHALINYINEIHTFADTTDTDTSHVGIPTVQAQSCRVYPNPTRGYTTVVTPAGTHHVDLSGKPTGLYILNIDGYHLKVVKY